MPGTPGGGSSITKDRRNCSRVQKRTPQTEQKSSRGKKKRTPPTTGGWGGNKKGGGWGGPKPQKKKRKKPQKTTQHKICAYWDLKKNPQVGGGISRGTRNGGKPQPSEGGHRAAPTRPENCLGRADQAKVGLSGKKRKKQAIRRNSREGGTWPGLSNNPGFEGCIPEPSKTK